MNLTLAPPRSKSQAIPHKLTLTTQPSQFTASPSRQIPPPNTAKAARSHSQPIEPCQWLFSNCMRSTRTTHVLNYGGRGGSKGRTMRVVSSRGQKEREKLKICMVVTTERRRLTAPEEGELKKIIKMAKQRNPEERTFTEVETKRRGSHVQTTFSTNTQLSTQTQLPTKRDQQQRPTARQAGQSQKQRLRLSNYFKAVGPSQYKPAPPIASRELEPVQEVSITKDVELEVSRYELVDTNSQQMVLDGLKREEETKRVLRFEGEATPRTPRERLEDCLYSPLFSEKEESYASPRTALIRDVAESVQASNSKWGNESNKDSVVLGRGLKEIFNLPETATSPAFRPEAKLDPCHIRSLAEIYQHSDYVLSNQTSQLE